MNMAPEVLKVLFTKIDGKARCLVSCHKYTSAKFCYCKRRHIMGENVGLFRGYPEKSRAYAEMRKREKRKTEGSLGTFS